MCSQNIKDCTFNRYALLGISAALGAGTLLTQLFIEPTSSWKTERKMGSFPDLRDNGTAMGKHLTPEVFAKLKDKYTSRGYGLDDLINSGLTWPHTSDENSSRLLRIIGNSSGLLAGDEQCYDVFAELLDPVICEVHRIKENSFSSEVNMDWTQIKAGKLPGAEVVSCRLSTSRNIRGFSLVPGCTGFEIENIGCRVINILQSPKALSPQQQHTLSFTSDHCLAPDSLPVQLSRDWPKGRFIWWTEDRRCRIFVNFWDHMKLVVTQPGGDMAQALRRYCELLASIEERLKRRGKEFMWSSKYGFMTSSVNNIGTGLHVEVKVRLPKLIEDPRLHRIIDVLPVDLESGADPANTNVVRITNKHKINVSEVDIVQQVVDSVALLLELDKRLRRGENVQDLLP